MCILCNGFPFSQISVLGLKLDRVSYKLFEIIYLEIIRISLLLFVQIFIYTFAVR